MRFINLLSILSLLLLLTACASIGKDETHDWTVERFYEEAKDALENSEYERAIEMYTKLESRYPYGRFAQQAQLETIYAYYKSNEPSSAVAAADRFIKLHPRHANVDYAYYLRGLSTFDQGKGFLSGILPVNPSERDPSGVRESFGYFKDLITRFPNSRYTPDAIERMKELRNTLAFHEIQAAKYYLKRGTYLAAVNRAKYVLEHYQRSAAIPDALVIMVQTYRKMELNDLANDALRVLKLNHPDHPELAELEQAKTDN